MAIRQTKLTVGQGEDLQDLINLQDETGSAVNIASATFTGSVKETYSSELASAEFTIETIAPLASGSLYIKLDASVTATLDAQDYVYDLLKLEGTETRRILEGQLTVRPSVTIA